MPDPAADAEIVSVSVRERQRIAHDLHDGLGQLLGGIALKAQALSEALQEKSHVEAVEAAEITRLVNEALAHTRILVRGLDPVLPQSEPFATMLAKLAESTERLFRGVTCRFTGDAALTLDSVTVAQHLFFVVQEATNNAIRHGKATRIDIELTSDREAFTLLIRDNGTGLAKGGEPSAGIGLRIMSHRVHSLGGTFHTEPGGRGGMIVRCRIPLTPPALL